MKKKVILSCILMLVFAVCLKNIPLYAFDLPIYEETFEGSSNWSADNGVWEIGIPTSGPGGSHEGMKCAGTILGCNYPAYTDSRLIGPYISPWEQGIELPEIIANEELHLRFWNWFSYSSYDYGQVQISVKDDATGEWETWVNVGGAVSSYSGGWSLKDVDLSDYAGQTLRIGFLHVADRKYGNASEGPGWFIDDIQIIKKVPEFTGDFEMGWVDWSASTGVWQVGEPSSGPGECYEGEQCAGTVLDSNYHAYTDSRLVSATVVIDELTGNEEFHLRFWNWFSYSSYDYGQVQISVKDDATGEWETWVNVGGAVSSYSGGWSLKDVDLSDYAGQTLRIGFLHVADRKYGNASEGPGWFIDDIQIIKKVPEFTGDFEMGWVDWSASTGVWQVGEPSSGPGECYEGEQCAGTVLDSNYHAYTDSRLVSATIDLSGCSASVVYLSYWEWFSYSSYDYGKVQISVWDTESEQWSDWVSLIQSTGTSPVWTLKYVDLINYAGKIFRIGFLHVADRKYGNASEGPGWFIDNIELVGPTQIMPTINTISFASYIPDPCTSFIDVFASDPCGGELTYTWQLPDGGTLVGTGANMEFIPPEIRVEPYRVCVAASSNATRISSFTKTLKIFTKVLYDLDGDDDIDGADLAVFLVNVEVNSTTISRFAEEFGMVACQ